MSICISARIGDSFAETDAAPEATSRLFDLGLCARHVARIGERHARSGRSGCAAAAVTAIGANARAAPRFRRPQELAGFEGAAVLLDG